jgi:hypothetical protein
MNKADRAERILGLIVLALGLAATYAFVYDPYASMVAGEPKVSTSFKGAMLGPLLIGVALIQIVLGERAPVLLGRSARPTWRTWAVLVVLLSLSYLVYYWLSIQTKALGYS